MNFSTAHGIAIVSIILQASVPMVIKAIPADAFVIGNVRLVCSSLIVLCFVKWRKHWGNLAKRDKCFMLGIGLCFALHWLTFFLSIKIGTAQLGALGVSTYGIMLSLSGAYFLRHTFGLNHFAVLIVAFGGSALIAGGIEGELSFEKFIGFLLGVLSAIFFSLLPILHQKMNHVPTGMRTLSQYGFGLIIFLPLAPLGEWDGLGSSASLLGYLIVVGTLASHTLWIYSSTKLSTTASSVISYLYPPAALIFAFLFICEMLNAMQILGVILIVLAGLWASLYKLILPAAKGKS